MIGVLLHGQVILIGSSSSGERGRWTCEISFDAVEAHRCFLLLLLLSSLGQMQQVFARLGECSIAVGDFLLEDGLYARCFDFDGAAIVEFLVVTRIDVLLDLFVVRVKRLHGVVGLAFFRGRPDRGETLIFGTGG